MAVGSLTYMKMSSQTSRKITGAQLKMERLLTSKTKMAKYLIICLLTLSTTGAVVSGEECGYIRRPLADTAEIETVVITLDCNQSTPWSNYIARQLRDDITHVALQLLNCYTVPVGLFSDVTETLTSLTVASEDAVQLLQGTFEGLERVTELRLLGFSALRNMSRSIFEPLRNIRTLVLDQFGSSFLPLPYLGSTIQKLSGTPIQRIVLNEVRDIASSSLLQERTFQADDFRISNASLKHLVISNTQIHYEGSIRRAFPHLTCFSGTKTNDPTRNSLPVFFDLVLLSHTLKEFALFRAKYVGVNNDLANVTMKQITPVLYRSLRHYPELLGYFYSRPSAENCTNDMTFAFGSNVSKVTIHNIDILVNIITKPICIEESNKVEYLDLSGSPMPTNLGGIRGLTKLKYLNLENTHVTKLPRDFLLYFPALEVLKLDRLSFSRFIQSLDRHFFGKCPTVQKLHISNCGLRKIPETLFSELSNLTVLQLSNNYLNDVNFDLRNCTKLQILSLAKNSILSINENALSQLEHLASRKKQGKLFIDLSDNPFHCLCNATHFVDWLQGVHREGNIELLDFEKYMCSYTNGTVLPVSKVSVSELKEQCSVITNLVNNSNCPCDEEERRALQQVWLSLDGFFCRDDAGGIVSMKHQPIPSCFNSYERASFVVPVVAGGILGITLLITIGLFYYYRHRRPVQQVRECLETNPVRFVRTALQYVMLNTRQQDEPRAFRFDIMVFAQDDDRSSIHSRFLEALRGRRTVITRDDFLPGTLETDALAECINVCRWILLVLTSNFLSDSLCVDFITRVQFRRPHALIPIVWEQPLVVVDLSISELLRTGEPLYWPGDDPAPHDEHAFWASVLDRTVFI